MMKNRMRQLVFLVFLLGLMAQPTFAQQQGQITVKRFIYHQTEKVSQLGYPDTLDASGNPYAVVRVKTVAPNDDVNAYRFDFGAQRHLVKPKQNEVLVFVQQNARQLTISRDHYATLSNYDLHTSLKPGGVYELVLSAAAPVVYMQRVRFSVQPKSSDALVLLTRPGETEAKPWGDVDGNGNFVQSLPLGTYSYRVLSVDYESATGQFVLNNKNQIHNEVVELHPRFSNVTLEVDSDAEIIVNGKSKGVRSWTGNLNAGTYQVECKQKNHLPSAQNITVMKGKNAVFRLSSPTPIVGTLSVISQPLGAEIYIDGVKKGVTPMNITDVIIGSHELVLKKEDYKSIKTNVKIAEKETTRENYKLDHK